VEECDSSILGYAYSPDNRVLAVLRYSPSCLSAWTVATNNSGVFNPRVRATITSSDGFGSARDEINAAVSEMLYVGPERPDRKVKALGRLFDNVTGKVLSVAETPFVDP
jgi:hypothetical protein